MTATRGSRERRRPTAALAYALATVVISTVVIGAVIVTFWMQALESKQKTESGID